MNQKFTVATIGIIYNQEQKFLITRRSEKEDHAPGIYSYPGGKLENPNLEQFNVLEANLSKEIFEETNLKISDITYSSSHAFTKDNGDTVVLISFIARYASGKLLIKDENEIAELKWLSINEIRKLTNTLPIIKDVYEQAYQCLNKVQDLEDILVAGLVINNAQEYLITKDLQGFYSFPYYPIVKLPGKTWEVLEKNLTKNLRQDIGIVIEEGMIPFTDQAFIGKEGFEQIIMFYVCRVQDTKNQLKINPGQSHIWQKFPQMEPKQFQPLVYQVFKKADSFITNLQQIKV